MFRKPEQSSTRGGKIGTEAVAAWYERRDQLRSKITEQADAEWAWLWRTRLSVLDFLIQRYAPKQASEPTKSGTAEQTPRHSPARVSAEFESTSPYDRVPHDRGAALSPGKREAIHRKLQSLRRTNAPRHLEAERQAQQMRETEAAYLAEYLLALAKIKDIAIQLDNTQVARALEVMDDQDYKQLRKTIIADLDMPELFEESLDEEMIRLILMEHGIERDTPR